ncbi:hypothetical protein PSPO01_02921 [Paraphaeosphaeria sporulosa]
MSWCQTVVFARRIHDSKRPRTLRWAWEGARERSSAPLPSAANLCRCRNGDNAGNLDALQGARVAGPRPADTALLRRSLPKGAKSGARTGAAQGVRPFFWLGVEPSAEFSAASGPQRSSRARGGVVRAACKTFGGKLWSQQTDRQLLNGNEGASVTATDAGCMARRQQTGALYGGLVVQHAPVRVRLCCCACALLHWLRALSCSVCDAMREAIRPRVHGLQKNPSRPMAFPAPENGPKRMTRGRGAGCKQATARCTQAAEATHARCLSTLRHLSDSSTASPASCPASSAIRAAGDSTPASLSSAWALGARGRRRIELREHTRLTQAAQLGTRPRHARLVQSEVLSPLARHLDDWSLRDRAIRDADSDPQAVRSTENRRQEGPTSGSARHLPFHLQFNPGQGPLLTAGAQHTCSCFTPDLGHRPQSPALASLSASTVARENFHGTRQRR